MEEDYYYSDDESAGYCSDSGHEDVGFEEDTVEERTAALPPPPSTQVITKESLLAAQRQDLCRVMDLLPLTEHHARALLIHFRWDVERLMAVVVDKGPDQLFAEAGVTISEQNNLAKLEAGSSITCNICFEDLESEAMTMMECGHCFCNDCWTQNFIVKINDGQSRRIRCMSPKCKTICDETVIVDLVKRKHPDIAEKFERFLLESYIEDNNKVKWCPSVPHCGNAIRVDDDDVYCEVECTCGKQFCFSCLSEAHSPCSCLMWELWAKKCRDESETVNWITVHTKPCPKCHKHVEKNGGCNLVSCICGQHFCWLCGGATGRDHTWTSIAGHSCGRYKEDEVQKSQRAKLELHRYMHYHNRYKLHMDSLKLESKLQETVQRKIAISENKASTLRDYSWVLNGLARLFRSRRILSYSYPFAYYMFGGELFKGEMSPEDIELKKTLFEDQQQQLEFNVERLSKFLEEPFDEFSDEQVIETRWHVINFTVLVDGLCLKMYQCIENDLLGSLKGSIHNIAPYRSKGVERASELNVSGPSTSSSLTGVTNEGTRQDDTPTGAGEIVGLSRPCSTKKLSGIDETGYASRKRARKETSRNVLIDLNMPAEC